MNRQMKRLMQRQGQMGPDGAPAPRTPSRPQPQRKERSSPGTFLREVKGELKKVAWPTRAEVVNYSTIVLFALVLLVGLIFVLDLVFAKTVLFLFET